MFAHAPTHFHRYAGSRYGTSMQVLLGVSGLSGDNVEFDEHLKNEDGSGRANLRNGSSPKTVQNETSKIALDVPRDREAPAPVPVFR